ncbi:hypothetical protein [Mucilaginibacter sp. dw_454]|uniref:hypothetical protein n=1 Tax=Mucilaginibacter sp. dw_454 TaxID=2720079 RepID=UPI0021040AF4|nr:hypothetical protein [Mucilaginibacter sp. dw_454]
MRLFVFVFAFGLMASAGGAYAQMIAFDPWHFTSVVENEAARSAAESTHNQYLGKIDNNIEQVNTNVGSVILAQAMIYNALSNVNSALKDGLAVKNIGLITSDIIYYLGQAMELAKDDPALLLTTSKLQNEMGPKAVTLVSDVSGYVLKEGNNVLADYNGRDQLLRKVIQQLQILDSMAYGTWKTMYWAKERGLLKTLNPWQNFVNQDKIFAAQIIQQAKYLNK